jgi:hypothetical protein
MSQMINDILCLLFSKSHQDTHLDKLGDVPQQVGVYRLRGAGHVDVMKQTVNDGLKEVNRI